MVLHLNYAQKRCMKTPSPILTPQISDETFTWHTHMANKNFAQHLTNQTMQHPISYTLDRHSHVHSKSHSDYHITSPLTSSHREHSHLLRITTHMTTIDVPDSYPNPDIPSNTRIPFLIPTVTITNITKMTKNVFDNFISLRRILRSSANICYFL